MLISTSKWPALQTIVPSPITSNISPAIASRLPVTVMITSARAAASIAGQHLEAVHHGFERAQRIDLADDHVGAQALGAHRDALAARAVADDGDHAAGDQDVGRAQDAVDRRLAGAVAVVEEVLVSASLTAMTG